MNDSAQQQETTEDPVFATAAPANDEAPAAADSSAESASAAPEQSEVTPEGAEARADLYKGMYDDEQQGGESAAANDNAEGAEKEEGKQDGEKSTVDKIKDTAISAGSKFGLKTALQSTGAIKEAIKKGSKFAGPLAGALAGGAVSAVENIQAYRDGKISGLRALGNTAVDAATGALPFGVSTLARWGAKKLGLYAPAS